MTSKTQSLYSQAEREHFAHSSHIKDFLERKAGASLKSAHTYEMQLRAFAQYIFQRKAMAEVDTVIEQMKKGEAEPVCAFPARNEDNREKDSIV